MSELKVGDRIKDNDSRMGNRVLTIERLWFPLVIRHGAGPVAVCKNSIGREVAILCRRIYTDGKPRRTGFSRVERP